MRKALHIGLKDLLVRMRDPAALGVMLAMPMVLILILGSALGGTGGSDGPKTKVVIVNLDTGSIGDEVSDVFTSEKRMRDLFETKLRDDEAAVRRDVERGEIAAALIIPRDFTKRLNDAKPVDLRLITDPGREVSASIFKSVVTGIATRISAASVAAQTTSKAISESGLITSGEQARALVDAAVDEAADAEVSKVVDVAEVGRAEKADTGFDALDYYAGGMSIMFLLFGAMFGAFSIVGERADQTLPRLLTTPTSRSSVVAGKMFGVFVVGAAQFAILYVFTRFLGVTWGDPVGLAVLIAATILAVTGLTILLSSLGKTQRAVGAIGPIVIQLEAAAGGSFFPIEILPKWLQPVHWLTVNGWALDGIEALRRGAAATAVLPNAAALLVMALVFFGIGIARLRFE